MQMKQHTFIFDVADIDVYSEELTLDELAEEFPDDPFLCSQYLRKNAVLR